jgi:hypothetical protein
VTGDLLLFCLVLFSVPVVLICGIVLAAMAAAGRGKPAAPTPSPDNAVRQEWTAAWHAHIRLAQLEGRVREMEQRHRQGDRAANRDGAA